MTHAELKARIDEGIPFTLHVADGHRYDVPHRDFVWLPPKSTVVIIAAPSPEHENETVSHTIPLLVVSGVTQVLKSNGSE